MALIDKYLPEWNISKKNECFILPTTPPDASLIGTVDFAKSKIIKSLFFLRGLPAKTITIAGFLDTGFIILEADNNELVLGLVAQPWKVNGNILKIPPSEFIHFHEAHFVKIAWNFTFEQTGEDKVRIGTETRINCTSVQARRYFSIYWFFIGYFSGVIRNEMLKLITSELVKKG